MFKLAFQCSKLSFLVFFVSTIFAVSACDAQEHQDSKNKNEFSPEERHDAIKEMGYYRLSSDCENQIEQWSETDPVPECAFERLYEIFDQSNIELKREFYDTLCSAEYAHAKKQVNYVFDAFAGSRACKKVRVYTGKSSPVPEMPEDLE